MGQFTNPRDLYFGEGARHEVKNLKGSRAMIVTGGGSMRRGGFLQDIEADLKEAGFEVEIFEGVESDPSVTTVMKGAEAMQAFQPDWIIGLGGGSPIDAAKAMWLFYEYPEETFDQAIVPFSFPTLRTKAKFCAIASTSGTATEVTAFSVITDYEKGIKYPLADFNITPDVAIVDPELTYTMPAKLCAHTGMDALTHAIEAYVSTVASMFTDANALHAIREIVEWLPKSYKGDQEARQHMHEAQCIAGMLDAVIPAEKFIIDAGGDLRIRSTTPIVIGLENPADTSRAVGTAAIRDGAFCASAPSRRHWHAAATFEAHHLINAIDGLPVRDVAATWVSAAAGDGYPADVTDHPTALADGLATALFVTPADTLAARFPGRFDCALLRPDRTALVSHGFPGRLFRR